MEFSSTTFSSFSRNSIEVKNQTQKKKSCWEFMKKKFVNHLRHGISFDKLRKKKANVNTTRSKNHVLDKSESDGGVDVNETTSQSSTLNVSIPFCTPSNGGKATSNDQILHLPSHEENPRYKSHGGSLPPKLPLDQTKNSSEDTGEEHLVKEGSQTVPICEIEEVDDFELGTGSVANSSTDVNRIWSIAEQRNNGRSRVALGLNIENRGRGFGGLSKCSHSYMTATIGQSGDEVRKEAPNHDGEARHGREGFSCRADILPLNLRIEAIKDDRQEYSPIKGGVTNSGWNIDASNSNSLSDWITPVSKANNSVTMHPYPSYKCHGGSLRPKIPENQTKNSSKDTGEEHRVKAGSQTVSSCEIEEVDERRNNGRSRVTLGDLLGLNIQNRGRGFDGPSGCSHTFMTATIGRSGAEARKETPNHDGEDQHGRGGFSCRGDILPLNLRIEAIKVDRQEYSPMKAGLTSNGWNSNSLSDWVTPVSNVNNSITMHPYPNSGTDDEFIHTTVRHVHIGKSVMLKLFDLDAIPVMRNFRLSSKKGGKQASTDSPKEVTNGCGMTILPEFIQRKLEAWSLNFLCLFGLLVCLAELSGSQLLQA